MVSATFNRYIWLFDTLRCRGGLTFEEISNLWKCSQLGDGRPLPIRTFHQHRSAVEELFGVKITCDPSKGYRYSLQNLEQISSDKTRQWILNTFSMSNLITSSHNMDNRIILEEVSGSSEYLKLVIEAMQQEKVLHIDYQRFGGHRTTYHFEPYAMRVFQRRWYMLGRIQEKDALRHLALDRIVEIHNTQSTFVLPKSFDARKYYKDSIGVCVDDALIPQKVRIRVYGRHVDYLRSLPLHCSQREVLTKHEQYSEFEYKLCLTPELTTQILSMGDGVEVLEPQELREEIRKMISITMNRYLT